MGTIQVPGRLSGRTYTVNIKGDAPSETEQARIRAMVEERESLFAQRYESQIGKPLAAPDDGTALGRGIARGGQQVKSALGTTVETVGQQLGLAGLAEYGRGMEEAAARRLFDLSLQQPAPTTREDVAAAEGFFPTIGKALTFAGELAGEQVPQLGAGLAGGAAGAGAGFLAAGPVGALAGFGVGSGLTEAPMLFGANVQRQEEEVAAGRKEAVDLTDALGATIGQAALTSVTNALAGAGVFVRPGARLFTRIASGAVVGGTTEGLNEVGQQVLERYQAGLPVDSPDAIKEYIDAGIAGGILGVGAGGLGGIAGPRLQEPVAPAAREVPPPAPQQDDEGEAPAAPTEPPAAEQNAALEDEGRPTGGVSIDEDLAEARMVYDERLAIAEEGGADPEEAKRIAAQAAVNYVDSLEEATRNRLVRFRNTMARMATGPTRGVMQPDIPDSAYAPEFGEVVQKDLFTAPEPPPPAPMAELTAETRPAAPQLKPIPFDQHARKPDSAELIPGTNVRGEAPIIDLDGRKIVLVDVNGVQVPFYLSSGLAGKKDVAAGKWYPILGIGPDGWINKGSQQEINDYYGSPELRAAAEELDATIGDIRNDKTVPKVKPSGAHIDAINTGLNPVANEEVDTRERFNANLADLLARIRAGAPAAETRPAAPATAASQFSERDIRHEMDGILLFEGPRSTEEELRKDAIANLQRRAGAPADQEPIFGEEWMEAARKQLPQDKSTGPLILDPFKNSPDPGSAGLSFMFGKSRPATPEGAQDDAEAAEAQPETVGAGVESRGRGVEQRKPDADVQPAEGVEAPAERRLGRSVSVPVGTDTAERVQPDTLTQLEERLAAARARAAELRNKVPAGVLQRELVGGKVDPALAKQVANLRNVLAREQKAADTARDAVPKKPTHPARPKKLAQYEAALAKANETQTKLAAAQDALGTAELAAGLQRAAVPKVPMNEKAKSAYTAYFNALQDADTLRQTLESERARNAVAPEQRPALPSLRSDILPELNVVYPAGGTRGLGQAVPSLRDPVIAEAPLTMLGQRKVLPPASVTWKVAEDVRKANIRERFSKFFAENASPALVRHTTARGGFNNEATWKNFPDWMSAGDQLRVLQLLGRPTREQRTKYKISEEESPRLTDEESAARTYFAKMLRPVDAIDMMLADLSVYYASYKSAPGQTDAGLQALLLGTGSDPAKLALNWVRANLSPETNKQIDLILKKQAEKDAVTADWIGAEGTDRVAGGRTARDAARKARKAAAEESGYDAMSIVRKMVAGDSRVALDQEMHYSVKAALNAGDLRGALQALADTTSNPELKDMASRFAKLVGTTRVRILYPGDSAKYIGNDRGTYVQQRRADIDPDYQNIILINGQTGMTNHVLMHEMAHALSSRFIDENPNHPVVKQLQDLLSALREVGPKQQLFSTGRGTARVAYPTDFYGLTNISEMVAEGYGRLAFGETDNGLRDLMKRTRLRDPVDRQVEFENPLNAWDRFKELVGNILNVIMRKPLTRRPRTKRIETVQVYETAADRFHRLVDGLLSEAPQVLPDSVLQAAVTKPLVGRNVLNNAVLNADTWSPAGRKRLGNLMSSAVPQPLRRALLGLLHLDWFNDLAGDYFPQIAKLKTIDDQRRGKINTLNGNMKPVLEDLLAYAQKSPELYAELMGIQGQATLANVDPTRPVSDYGADQEKVRVWHELNRKLAADSTGEMRRLFKKTRNILRAYRTEVERVLKSRVKDITDDTAKQNQLFAQLMQKLDEENAIDPYFSLMRRGDYWLEYTAEDTTAAPVAIDPLGRPQRPTTRFVQAFESPFALAQFRAQLEAKKDDQGNPVAWDFEENRRPISDINREGYVPPAFVQGALNVISAFDNPSASAEERAKIDDARDAIHSMFLRLTPDHSLLKSFIKRKGTRGFIGDITPLGVIDAPIDMVQALADKTAALSYQLANIEYGGKIQNLINSAGETRNKLAKSGGMTLGEKAAVDAYHDEFLERAKFAKTPQVTGAAQLARGITFNMTLGFSIAGAVNNLMQIPMIGATELAGRYGMGASLRELGFAMRALKNAGKTQQVLSYGPDGREVRELDNVDNFGSLANYFTPDESGKFQLRTDMKIPAALRDKLADLDVLAEVLSNNGMLNASMSQEMLEAESGWLHKINRWGGFLMHHAERFNRQSMAIATYNLELGKTKGRATLEAKLAAAKKAVEIAERVNGAIGASTAPRFAQSAIGSVVFMFKRFGLHMARYIIGTANQALRGATSEDRAVARYQIIGMLGTTALFAGVQGLPFFSELMTIFNVFFTDDDEERPEVIVQKFLGEPYYHGALNYLLGVEIASRISMSGLIFRENKIEKDQSVLYDLFEMFGGPAVGVFMNTERGIQLLSEGEFYRGVETMMPSALKSLLKAFRFSTEGATTLRGDEVIPLTPADVVKQALGYTPVDYARQQERVSGAKRIDEAVRNRKRKLLRRYNLALADGDFAEAREALADMREFNRQHPEDVITSDTINRSSRSFRQRSTEMISGVSFTPAGRARAQQYIDEFDQDTTLWGQ